jgi:DNA-binding SARP family transcriptional activator
MTGRKMDNLTSTVEKGTADALTIRLFGVFHVARAAEVLTDKLKRSRQLEGLLKYLIAYRARYVSPEELVDALWENKSCDNPAKAVQNLVYRLRMLIDLPGHPSHILYVNGGYGWNAQSGCFIDLEEFDRALDEATARMRAGAPDTALYFKALQVYSADFLANSLYDLWTVSLRQAYRLRFTSCVETLIGLLKAENRHQDIISVCEKAMGIDTYDEKVHVAFLEALVATNRIAHARMHYSYITELLYRDLGISPSAELKETYAKINGNAKYVHHDMDAILSTFTDEERATEGPYFCDEEIFHELFKLERRRLQRNGQSNCLMLLTVSNANFGIPSSEVLKAARGALKEVLMASLRKGDVVCVWNDAQLLVMLSSLTFEDAEIISHRIITRFHKAYAGIPLMLQKKISPVQAEVS